MKTTIELELTPEILRVLEILRGRYPGKTDGELIMDAVNIGLDLAGIPRHIDSIAVRHL